MPNRYSIRGRSFFLPRGRGPLRFQYASRWIYFTEIGVRDIGGAGLEKPRQNLAAIWHGVRRALASAVMKIETLPRSPGPTGTETRGGSPLRARSSSEQRGMQRTRDQEDSINIWSSLWEECSRTDRGRE